MYGGASPSTGFDCSGLVCYCYGWKYGHNAGNMRRGVKAAGNLKTSIDQLSVGDLVFCYYDSYTDGCNHVGIYVGGGQMIHAANPAYGVIKGSIFSFCGGGPY